MFYLGGAHKGVLEELGGVRALEGVLDEAALQKVVEGGRPVLGVGELGRVSLRDLEDGAGRVHVGARIRENIFYTERAHFIIDNELTWKMARKGCMSARGGAPSAISMTVIPSDQMSASPS